MDTPPPCSDTGWAESSETDGLHAGDKCLFGFVLATLWWQLGGDYSDSNVLNIAGVLNFWVTMPAFGCAICSRQCTQRVHNRSQCLVVL